MNRTHLECADFVGAFGSGDPVTAVQNPSGSWRGARGRRLFLGLVVAWLGMAAAFATRWVPLTIEQLSVQAGLVVHGRVSALEVGRDSGGRIFTRVELDILDVWKGTSPAGRCEWVFGGGVLGEQAATTDAQARYEMGEELVAYLVRNPAGEWVTVGMAQGCFPVRTDASGGRWASNLFWGDDGSSVTTLGAGGVRFPTRRPLELEELKRRTQEAGR